jgi:hypothetical protein
MHRNPLVFDSKVSAHDRDQTHALVIGVGTYPYLPGGGSYQDCSTVPTYGMEQLTSPVASARAFADWLCRDYRNESAPLGSVDLLLSPARPYRGSDGVNQPVDPPEMSYVKAAYDNWYARSDSRPGNIALFYFCGHGLGQGFNSLLLCSDYGADEARPFDALIDLYKTLLGTTTCRARAHCFFIDACRTADDLEATGVALRAYLKTPIPERDYRLLRSSARDQVAYGQQDKVSVFTEALLGCLRDGIGADRRREDDACWVITTESLQNNLVQFLRRKQAGRRAAPTCDPNCPLVSSGPTDLHEPEVIRVMATITCRPQDADAVATLSVSRPGELDLVRPPGAGRWEVDIVAGACDVSATFSESYRNVLKSNQKVLPPNWKLPLVAERLLNGR